MEFALVLRPTLENQPVGTHVNAVGVISRAESPLDYLQPQDPTREYTIYFSGLVSLGTTTTGSPGARTYSTAYSGGTIEIYEDLTPDHEFSMFPPNATVPSTFVDGVLMVQGGVWILRVVTNDFSSSQVDGASGDLWFEGLRNCLTEIAGTLNWGPDAIAPGYLLGDDGGIPMDCADPAGSTTWGRIKANYH